MANAFLTIKTDACTDEYHNALQIWNCARVKGACRGICRHTATQHESTQSYVRISFTEIYIATAQTNLNFFQDSNGPIVYECLQFTLCNETKESETEEPEKGIRLVQLPVLAGHHLHKQAQARATLHDFWSETRSTK